MTTKVPTKLSWNFKKADWPRFTNLLDNELRTSPLNFNQHPDKLCNDITNIMIRYAKETIPLGTGKIVFWSKHLEELKRKLFWSEHLEELKRKRDALGNTADQTGRTEDVQTWRQQSTVLRQAILQAKRTAFDNFLSNINYQSDSQRTFQQISTIKVIANAL
ncbi:unnamed protein product [Rodentolepis nana]|uniref:Uncharacterized protein n=1 Tax=Rodentolepis nana TaxID=102285 RepID=A0A0R3TB56_RODNA|nr:unnamed protein product [Rodentolepis nana]